MRIDEIFGDEDDLIEQLKYKGAPIVVEIYNIINSLSNNFTLIPDKDLEQQIKMIGIKVFSYREQAIKLLGEESNTVKRINTILDYIQKL
jgi:hypothetical protein